MRPFHSARSATAMCDNHDSMPFAAQPSNTWNTDSNPRRFLKLPRILPRNEMTGLLALPRELLIQIARSLDSHFPATFQRDRKHMYNFAKTCSFLYKVLEHVLFEKIQIPNQGGAPELRHQWLLPLARTIEGNFKLGLCLKEFELRLACPWTGGCNENLTAYQAGITRQCNSFGNFLNVYAPSLRSLEVPYPLGCNFLDQSWPDLKKLAICSLDTTLDLDRPEINMDDLLQGLDVVFLGTLLLSPKLEELHIKTTTLSGENVLVNLRPRCSALKKLTIRTLEMQESTIRVLLRAPRGLTDFELTNEEPLEPYDHDSDDEGLPPPRRLPHLTTIYKNLKHQSATLERLSIHGAAFSPNQCLTTGHHSFRGFSCLKSMKVDVAMLLGWTDCEHIAKNSDESKSLEPRAIGTLLPDTLCELNLYIDWTFDFRKKKDYVYQIIAGIIEARRRLVCLKSVKISAIYPHCNDCFYTIPGMQTRSDLIDELDRAKKLATDNSIEFEYFAKQVP